MPQNVSRRHSELVEESGTREVSAEGFNRASRALFIFSFSLEVVEPAGGDPGGSDSFIAGFVRVQHIG